MMKSFAAKSIVKLFTSLSDKNFAIALDVLKKIAHDDHKEGIDYLKGLVKNNHPSVRLVKRMMKNLDARCRDKMIENLVVNAIVHGNKVRNELREKDVHSTSAVLISPTMRCNLKCDGCYAFEYSRDDDLSYEEVDRVIGECKELGTYFYTFLGGEPFVRKDDIVRILKKHNDCYFQIYTNAWLVDEELVEQLKDAGNCTVILSIEGTEKDTDARRGAGTYKKIKEVISLLNKHGVPLGFSAVVTKNNYKYLSSSEFFDELISMNGIIIWFFLYMPIGMEPDLTLMTSPEQRNELRKRLDRIRANKEMALVDFWNDAPLTGGCIAGREYVHVNSKGDVEPCIFTHFSVDNIKSKSMKEIFNSDFFKELRRGQPINDNLLLPCMLIDNPDKFRELYAKFSPKPTHKGADSLVNDEKLMKGLDEYSNKVHEVYSEAWEEYKGANGLS